MIPSLQNHPWLLNVFLILLLHSTAGVGGAKFTIANRCSEPIWPVIQDKATKQTAEYELPISSSVAFQRPSGWNGRVWAKTGCVFNDSGGASCTTGDTKYVTLAEFSLRSGSELSTDLYDVSLVDGFNLPLLIEPSSRGRCASIGCVEDLNKSCPRELKTQGRAACRGPCAAFGTPEYCCPDGPAGSCRPTNYSRVFKKACPTAYSYVYDDASSLFACTPDVNDDDYVITFCHLLTIPPASNHAYPPHNINPQSRINTSPAYPPHTFNPQQRANGKNHTRAKEIITIVSASVISGAILVSITVICVFHKRRHSRNGPKRKRNRDVENLLAHHGSLAPKRYRYSEIKKITKSLSDKLGQGGFGSVYKGMLADGRLVAVKILTEIDSNGEEFINEVASITRTSHVNIVSLLGFCDEGNKRALVYEFMPNKSLDNFLGNHNGDGGFMDLNKLYEIAVGIAKGLEYLHTGCITRIVHFDIKPQNILLDEDLCPKISDFGLAKLCKKKQSVLSVLGTRGTAGYIAPEVFSRNFGGVSHKSDVYSYGMMLLEMAGARKNVGTVAIQSSENYFPDRIYDKLMIDVTNDDLDDEWMMIGEEEERRRKMMLIGFWCIQTSPSERPSMSKVVEMLEGSLDFIQLPPKPSLCSPVISDQQNSSSSSSAHVDTDNLASD